MWKTAVGNHFNPQTVRHKMLYICDLHFDKSCAYTEASLILINIAGEPRQRMRLKTNAVPSIFDSNAQHRGGNSNYDTESKRKRAAYMREYRKRRKEASFANADTNNLTKGTNMEESSAYEPEDIMSTDINDETFIKVEPKKEELSDEEFKSFNPKNECNAVVGVKSEDETDGAITMVPFDCVYIKEEPYEIENEDNDDNVSDKDYVPEEDSKSEFNEFEDDRNVVVNPTKECEQSCEELNDNGIMKDVPSYIQLKVSSGPPSLKCNRRSYEASGRPILSKHLKQHTPAKRHNCRFCDYSTAVKSDLMVHITTHTGDKPFKCSICDYSAARKDTFKNHMNTHSGDRPYKCSCCDYRAAHRSNLTSHMRIHSGYKPFKCTFCDYSTTRNEKLKYHMNRHSGDKPYKCRFCDYSAAQKSSLTDHMRQHTGDKPFKCSVCDYSTIRKGRFKEHMSMHSGNRPYKCSFCDYSSVQRSHLTVHMRRHSGDRPFKCNFCDYSAFRKGTLKKHMSTHSCDGSYK